MKNAKIVEVVLFKPTPEISEADVLKITSLMQSKVVNLPGYVDRQLLKNSEGQWVDLVWWENLELAQVASDMILQDAELAPHLSLFKNAEVTMLHLEPMPLTTA